MVLKPKSQLVYSRAERLSDATIHVIGLISALVGVSVIITLTVIWRDEKTVLIGTLIYSVSLVAMLSASAIYHMTSREEWKDLLRRIDQSAIYMKIAGTYTPFAILAGTGMGPLLTGIWGAAFAGVSLKMLAPERFVTAALLLYLGMGWVAVIAGGDMIASLSPAAYALMLAGGAIYTTGVIFYLWQRLPFHNTIWHAMVLVATVVFYAALFVEIADIPGA